MSEVKPCPCTMFEQDEDCPEGYPSMLCGICHGTGNAPEDQITALAVEMIKIASDVGEPEDPFAAWESVSLITVERDRLREALKLADGRLALLLQTYPDESDIIDHPIATKYVLERVRAVLSPEDIDIEHHTTCDDPADEIERLRYALAPFAAVAKHDIGSDEVNSDFFQPMEKNNHAERLRVGHFRQAFNTFSLGGDVDDL